MLLESLLVLDEGIVRDGCDIDLAVIHALGFPAFVVECLHGVIPLAQLKLFVGLINSITLGHA